MVSFSMPVAGMYVYRAIKQASGAEWCYWAPTFANKSFSLRLLLRMNLFFMLAEAIMFD